MGHAGRANSQSCIDRGSGQQSRAHGLVRRTTVFGGSELGTNEISDIIATAIDQQQSFTLNPSLPASPNCWTMETGDVDAVKLLMRPPPAA